MITHTTIIDPKGRYAISDITVDRSRLILCNIYAPNVYSKDFFLHILTKLYQLGDKPVILGGDFNIVIVDRYSSQRNNTRAQSVGIPYIIKYLRLMDTWRMLHPLERDYTCNLVAHGTLCRIDYLLASESLFPLILDSNIEPICLSDHTLCWMWIARSVERGPHKQWRFPSHLTHSIKFTEAVLNVWTSYETNNAERAKDSPLLFWHASKSVLRGHILTYIAHRDKKLHESFSVLQNDLTSAYLKFIDTPTLTTKESYLSHKAAFEALLTQMELKYTFLASSKFHRFGNRSGKLLSNLLKGQHPPTIIKRMRVTWME